jgi:hypothetical protein
LSGLSSVSITDTNVGLIEKVVKLQRADGGYLGTQRRRRTWLPTIHSGELEASIEPEISEWGNPLYGHLNP